MVGPRKIRKMLSMNLFQKRIDQIKAFWMVSSWWSIKRLVYGGTILVPRAGLISWRTFLPMNEKLLFFKMISSNKVIV